MKSIIVCIPDGAPGYMAGPYYVMTTCGCGRRMWIGPKSHALVAAGDADAICGVCAYEAGLPVEQVQILNPQAGGSSDLDALRRASTATILESGLTARTSPRTGGSK